MNLSQPFQQACAETLSERLGEGVFVQGFEPISGGCINQTGKLFTNRGAFFIKWNDAARYPGMFEAEAKGLQELNKPGVIKIPEALAPGEAGSDAFLILEFIISGSPAPDFWDIFAQQLSKLHRTTRDRYGLDHDNYMGSLRQYNRSQDKWSDFFITQRLEPQVGLARDKGEITRSHVRRFENLYVHLEQWMPDEQPALIHGDLWSGNFMINEKGMPCLIDPAACYSHREAELAMTRLFGGFDAVFYEAYHRHYPLESGFQARYDLYNLYPLMIHVNLFGGGGYLSQTSDILKRFTG